MTTAATDDVAPMTKATRSDSLTSVSSGVISTSSSESDENDNGTCQQTKVIGSASGPDPNLVQGQTEYYWSSEEEPHAARRREILQKYPQIKKLYGPCPMLKWTILGVVSVQFVTCYLSAYMSTWQFLLAAYVISGTANHMMMLGMHELAHNLGFKKPLYNRLLALFANLPLGVPSCATFRKYHLEHHRYQGHDGIDVDIPTPLEAWLFKGKLRKLFFVTFQIAFYALRPVLVYPKPLGFWEVTNWFTSIGLDLTVLYFGGIRRLAYLLLGSLLGTGLHPVAGHFISEHYVFQQSREPLKGGGEPETYSYYGFWNVFAFNVGYHNEHHDFPYVPGSRLPQVHDIAKEYYDSYPQCESWPGVLWSFIMNDDIGGFSRIKRHPQKQQSQQQEAIIAKKES
jgi:sphingolipid delta-4 desaturase